MLFPIPLACGLLASVAIRMGKTTRPKALLVDYQENLRCAPTRHSYE